MRRNFIVILLTALGISALLLSGCVRNYAPGSSWEKREFLRSNFRIHPEDVRRNLKQWQNAQVAWTGIIREYELYETDANYEVILLMEHHYFDWKVENFEPDQVYYPSSRGQGLFQTSWFLKKSADLDYFKSRFSPGNLAIVYAVPDTVINDVVLLESRYVRIIDRTNFQLDQSEYIPKEVLTRPYQPHGTGR